MQTNFYCIPRLHLAYMKRGTKRRPISREDPHRDLAKRKSDTHRFFDLTSSSTFILAGFSCFHATIKRPVC